MTALRLLFLPALVVSTALPSRAAETASHGAVAAAADAPLAEGLYARFQTSRGDIVAQLFPDLAPLTVANFVGLAEGTIPFEGRPAGKPFYDGLVFHRVVEGFVVQGGDPMGTGEGGPGYEFPDEFTPRLKHDTVGTLAMANSGPNTNGCQFYFTLNPVNRLNYKHTVFGRVVRGTTVLPKIVQGDALQRVEILRRGSTAESYRPDAETFAALRASAPTISPRDSTLPPLFVDDAGLDMPEFYPQWLNDKLHHYQSTTGITVFVRITPPATGAPQAADAAQVSTAPGSGWPELHRRLAGSDPRSATLVFDAATKDWRIWLGDGLIELLGLPPVNGGATGAREALHATKQKLLQEARKQLEAGEPARRSVDAAVTALIEALDEAAMRPPQ